MAPLTFFVRHGQTGWNAEYRLQGQAETDITATGRRQADRNGRRLAALIADPAGFDFVASPLRRTRETMERLRSAMGLPAQGYRTDERLMELSFGAWQGSTFAELEQREPGCTAARMRDKWGFVPPGGESYAMLRQRVLPWFEGLAEPTICVTHGGVIRVVFSLVAGLPDEEAAALDIPQDQVLRMEDGRLEWL